MSVVALSRGVKHVSVIVAASLLATTIVLTLQGAATWLPVIAVAAPWTLALTRRYGASIALPAVTVLAALLLLLSMTAAAVVGLPLLPTILGTLVIAGAGGIAVLAATPLASEPASAGSRALWIAPLLGSAVWLTVMIGSMVVPGASRFSWLMAGDSANNLLFAREIVYAGGIEVGAAENPVPLPAGLLAAGMLAGRDGLPGAELFRHDIAAFTLLWALIIGMLCYAIGVAAATTVSRDRPWLVAAVAATASLLPLSWFVTGYPLEFGFFNAHITLVIVFLSWVVTLAAKRAPWLALSALFASGTVLLAVWSPFILVSVALGFTVIFRERKQLLASRGGHLTVLIVTLAQLVAYGALVTLPSLLALSSALAAPGGVYPFSRAMILAAFVVGFLVALACFVLRRWNVAWPLAALLAALGIGQAVLLFVSRDQASVWTYYPTKFAWLASVIALVLVSGVVAGLISALLRGRVAAGAATTALAVVSLTTVNWAPTAIPTYLWMNPAERILSGQFFGGGDSTFERIADLSDPAEAHILWNSGDSVETTINFWLLQLHADSTTANSELRTYAYGYYDLDRPDDLCAIVALMDGEVTVHTADSNLEADLAATCPDARVLVEVE
jgi:hypothetical protein